MSRVFTEASIQSAINPILNIANVLGHFQHCAGTQTTSPELLIVVLRYELQLTFSPIDYWLVNLIIIAVIL